MSNILRVIGANFDSILREKAKKREQLAETTDL